MKKRNAKPAKRAAQRQTKAGSGTRKQTFAIDGPGDRMRVVFAAPN
jgi:hypothetical protein